MAKKNNTNTLHRQNINHHQTASTYQRHGRTTATDDHSDLQVLQRIKRYLLPKNFTISQDLLDEIVAGYDMAIHWQMLWWLTVFVSQNRYSNLLSMIR